MTHRPIRITLLAFALAMPVTGCPQTQASPQVPTTEAARKPAQENAGQYTKLLARMQTADAEQDAVRRCLDYPAPPGVKWTAEIIRARCDLLAPAPTFIHDGAAAKAPADAAAKFDAGFAALMDEAHASPAMKDGRINRAVGVFSDGAALPYADKWVQHSPRSAFAHAARGASLLAKAGSTRGGAYARQTEPADLDTAAEQAQAAAEELRQAYELEPRLSAACALRTTALMLSDGNASAIAQGRTCARAHPESYFASAAWGSAAEPRWGGSQEELDEVMRFLEANRAKNPLHGTVVGKIKAYDLLVAGAIGEEDVRRLEQYASHGPSSYLLNVISTAWGELGERELWMAYLSSAVRFDFDPGDTYRNMRAQFNIVARPEWAVIDYRFLKEKYKGDPAIEGFLSQAEQNVRDGTGVAYAKSGGVRYKGDHQYKAILMSECLSFGTSDRKLEPVMENCSDRLVAEWPDDPGAWFVRARVQQHRGHAGWQEAARRYLAMADATVAGEAERIGLVTTLLEQSAGAQSQPPGQP
ncbi:tetratricopeptide repeat protein [Thermomonas carbonis]|uniref:DUF4034 domain-containing protein n=1 Tax=Thermomonas carbonis TaxID=1463158 RepID=A0A7G9SPN3_9GAMM|nr:tetratricopeptide repeat protein [Thermomonas carbonis]QNN69808.1 DUF4034 domain-containing protein [Thermomonas carbonis]GHB95645.1 hypothetical protein GCM10010080_04030 [Thermomonas carbonis]